MVTTPDSQQWDFPIYGQGLSLWPLDLPRWLFNTNTLTRLLKASGYKILKVTRFETQFTLPADFLSPDIPEWRDSGNSINPTLPTTMLNPAEYLRIFARQDRKGIFSSKWAEQQEYHPAKPVADFEAVLSPVEE